ncbi:MAG TPA: hypothetical protein PK177_10600 [Burkholderiaceae bacterium]|nr:hypothetical protein [Burkholderiaceae bacterium]
MADLRNLVLDVAPALVAGALALALRHFVIEPATIAHVCDPQPWQGWCAMRSTLLQLFVQQRLGWFALAAGVLAFASARPLPVRFALAVGVAGLILYSYEPSAVGTVLAALALPRSRRKSILANA